MWDGKRVLIFGGSVVENGKYSSTDQILSFDPKSHQLRVLNASLPYSTSDVAAVWGDGRAYVFLNNSKGCEVYAFYTTNDSLVRMNVSCPSIIQVDAFTRWCGTTAKPTSFAEKRWRVSIRRAASGG